MFDLKAFLAAAESALDTAEKVAATAANLNIPFISPVAAVAVSIGDVAQAILTAVEEGQVALTTTDKDELKALVERLTKAAEDAEAKADAAEQAALAK